MIFSLQAFDNERSWELMNGARFSRVPFMIKICPWGKIRVSSESLIL